MARAKPTVFCNEHNGTYYCGLPQGHDGPHDWPAEEAAAPAPPPITVSEDEQAKAAKRRTAAAKGAATVKRRQPRAEPAALATPPPAPEPGRPVCPRCGRDDRLALPPAVSCSQKWWEEEAAAGLARPWETSLGAFCDRCLCWCGTPLEEQPS